MMNSMVLRFMFIISVITYRNLSRLEVFIKLIFLIFLFEKINLYKLF